MSKEGKVFRTDQCVMRMRLVRLTPHLGEEGGEEGDAGHAADPIFNIFV